MVDTTLSILCKSSNGHCTKHIQMHSHLILWSSAMFYQHVLQSYTGSDKKSMMWICICICVCICILRKMGLNNATGLKLLLSGLGKLRRRRLDYKLLNEFIHCIYHSQWIHYEKSHWIKQRVKHGVEILFFSRVLHRTQVHFYLYLNLHLYLDCDVVLLHTNDICIL